MEERILTCIVCPMGCTITVTLDQGEVTSVTGNTCPRGAAYARKEVTHPTRVVTSTVRVHGSRSGAVSLPCKTARDVPKERVFAVMEALKGVSVPAPVSIGEVVLADAAGTGVDVVATKNVD